MRALYVLVTIIMFTACERVDIDESDLAKGRVMVIGHGGAGFQKGNHPVPTNSMLSIKKAIDVYNADGIEVDVQLSGDGKIILYHSEILDDKTTCQGYVSDYSKEELKDCFYREDFAVNAILDEPVISLEDVLSKYSGYKYKPYIFLDTKYYQENYAELSEEQYYSKMVERIIFLTEEYAYSDKLVIEGRSVFYLNKLREKNKSLKLFFNGYFDKGFQLVLKNNWNGLTLKSDMISKEQVQAAHEQGKFIAMYGVSNQKSTKEALEKTPDFIQTDNIRLLTRYLD